MLAAFSDANLACISHATRFVSTAALVRIGIDHLSQKKKRKTEKNLRKTEKNLRKTEKNLSKTGKNLGKTEKNLRKTNY